MGGGKVREPWAGVALGVEMCRKQRAEAASYPGDCMAGVKGAKCRTGPEGTMWRPVTSP